MPRRGSSSRWALRPRPVHASLAGGLRNHGIRIALETLMRDTAVPEPVSGVGAPRPLNRHAGFRHVAEPNLILRATVGSTAHGLHLAGTDDRDEMGVCIEPPEYVIGLERFEQWIHRSAEEREWRDARSGTGRRGRTPPSRPGDLDPVVSGLRTYARLAAAGNPTVLVLLHAEPLYATEAGRELQRRADLFAS
jgi:hypothetical protein